MSNHQKSGFGTIFAGILSVLLVFILIAGITVGFLSNGFQNWDRFKHPSARTEQTDGSVTDENGNGMTGGKVYPLSSQMLFTAPTAEIAGASNGVTVTATVYPEEATNKELDWSVSFVNAESSWASGKTVTDYVTVTPNADDTSVAVVKCLAPFGEQIKITVTSRDNPDVSAECIADYGSRVNGGEYALTADGFDFELEGVLPFYIDFDDFGNSGERALYCELNATYEPVYTKLTVASSSFVLRVNPFIRHLLWVSAQIHGTDFDFGEWEFSFEEIDTMPLSVQLFDSLILGELSDVSLDLHSQLVSGLNELLNFPEDELEGLIEVADDPEAVFEAYERYSAYLDEHADAEEYAGILPLFELVGSVDGYDCLMPLGVRFTDFFVPVESIDIGRPSLVF